MSQLVSIQDRLLSGVSSMLQVEGLIADLVLPSIPSKEKTGKLGKYGKNHLRIEHSLVGGRAGYKRVESIVRSSTGYSIESHGLEGMVSEDDYRNVYDPYKAEEDETLGVSSLIAIGKESAVASAFTDSAVLTQNTTLVGTAQFNDYANSDPIGVFKTARLSVWNNSGKVVNKAIIPWDVLNTLAYSPAILDALGFTYNRAGQLNEAEIAKAIGVDQVFVAKGKYNSPKEGQSDALASIWGKHIVMYYAPDKAAPYQSSLGYKMVLSGQEKARVFKYNMNNPPNSTGILVDESYDYLFSDITCAYLIKNAIA